MALRFVPRKGTPPKESVLFGGCCACGIMRAWTSGSQGLGSALSQNEPVSPYQDCREVDRRGWLDDRRWPRYENRA